MRVLAPWKALNTRTVVLPVPRPGREAVRVEQEPGAVARLCRRRVVLHVERVRVGHVRGQAEGAVEAAAAVAARRPPTLRLDDQRRRSPDSKPVLEQEVRRLVVVVGGGHVGGVRARVVGDRR